MFLSEHRKKCVAISAVSGAETDVLATPARFQSVRDEVTLVMLIMFHVCRDSVATCQFRTMSTLALYPVE